MQSTVSTGSTGSTGPTSAPKATGTTSPTPPAGPVYRRFHGTVDIDPPDPVGAFTNLVENVIAHFTEQYGTGVNITIEIEARRPEGFDQKIIRTVRENARVLKFDTAEFEEE